MRRSGEQAREIQRRRFCDVNFCCNSEMGPAEAWKFCSLYDSAKGLLQKAMSPLNLSAMVFHRILKVSRAIADLDAANDISVAHLAEALQYRQRGFQ